MITPWPTPSMALSYTKFLADVGAGTVRATALATQMVREFGLSEAISPKDTVVPFETARRLARALPDVRLQLVEGAGHHLSRRAAEVVADAIMAFLAATEITAVPPTRPALT
ncbi:MAG: alpha/beta fold hydrolase [Streptosporangiaceae bacterium]